MNKLFKADYEFSYSCKYHFVQCLIRLILNHELRVLFWFREYQSGGNIIKKIVKPILRHYRRKYGIELPIHQIPTENYLGGIKMIHPWCITVNADAILGNFVTLYKGCTIGEIKNGKKKGYPQIGNNVTLYANSTVCGNITIGENSEITAGAFVNFDVPPNSIVIGNPGIIHKKK